MKNRGMVFALILIAVSAVFFLWPDEPLRPCKQVRSACAKAGFKQRGQGVSKREFSEACFQPVLNGQTIENVNIDPQIVEACRQRQAKRVRDRQDAAPPEDDSDEDS